MTPPALPDPFQPFTPSEMPATARPKFRWHKFLGCLRKFWWLPLITLTLSCIVAGINAYLLPASYSSGASMVQNVKLQLPENSMFRDDDDNFLGTLNEVLQTTKLHDEVIARLTQQGVKIPRDKNGQLPYVGIGLGQSARSSVFKLQAVGPDAEYTRAYLAALMDAYLAYRKESRALVTGSALDSITEQVQKTDHDLKEEQEILTNFRRTNNLVILQQEAASAGQYLMGLKTQLSDFQFQDRLLLATLLGAEINATNGSAGDSLPAGLNPSSGVSSSYAAAQQTLQTLLEEREKLNRYLRPKHPKMVKLNEQIERTKKLLGIYVQESHGQLLAEREMLKLKMANIVDSIKEWETKVTRVNALIAQADQLKINVQRFQEVYDRLQSLVQSVQINRNIDQESLRILDPPSIAYTTHDRQWSMMKKGVMVGLALGVGLILLLTLRDDRFNSVVELNERLGDAVIGQIPDTQVIGENVPLLLEDGDNQYMLAESYRNLRSALLFMKVDGSRPKIILITSALPGEGKSTVAANLARTLALSGSRVLLMDCDLRKGVVHERMGLSREPGLVEVLRGKAVLEQAIQTGSVPNLSFITRGKSSAESADLFLGVAFAQILAWLREQFDYVLLDSSPVLATDDAATLAPMTDGALIVVRGNFTGGKQVNEALDQLYQRQSKILGMVFNRANTSASSYHYYKYKEYQPSNED